MLTFSPPLDPPFLAVSLFVACLSCTQVSNIPTNFFLAPAEPGEAINVNVDVGKTLRIELLQVSNNLDEQGRRQVNPARCPRPSAPCILKVGASRCGST